MTIWLCENPFLEAHLKPLPQNNPTLDEKIVELFGGKALYNKIPFLPLSYPLNYKRPDQTLFAYPIIRGTDTTGTSYISLRIKIKIISYEFQKEEFVHYFFIRKSEWQIKYAYGDRRYLGIFANALIFLFQTNEYAINSKAFDLCKQLIANVQKKMLRSFHFTETLYGRSTLTFR